VNLAEAEFRELFRGSPIKRTKWRGLVRNACIALGNTALQAGEDRYIEVITALRRLTELQDTVISESARWALSRIQRKDKQPDGPEATAS
jgi:epoxyqueuosine reductase